MFEQFLEALWADIKEIAEFIRESSDAVKGNGNRFDVFDFGTGGDGEGRSDEGGGLDFDEIIVAAAGGDAYKFNYIESHVNMKVIALCFKYKLEQQLATIEAYDR